jgi:CheY-like chemotaxis protein
VNDQRCVLIVDPSEETREVLQTALERRGLRTLAAGRGPQGLELARRHHPDLIVLDAEMECDGRADLSGPLAAESAASGGRMVLLGSGRAAPSGVSRGEFVAKPYHYAALIRRIEELLAAAPHAAAATC